MELSDTYSSWCWNSCRCCRIYRMICQIVCFMPVVIIIPPRLGACSLTIRWFQKDTTSMSSLRRISNELLDDLQYKRRNRYMLERVLPQKLNIDTKNGVFICYFSWDVFLYILSMWFSYNMICIIYTCFLCWCVYFQFESFFLLVYHAFFGGVLGPSGGH